MINQIACYIIENMLSDIKVVYILRGWTVIFIIIIILCYLFHFLYMYTYIAYVYHNSHIFVYSRIAKILFLKHNRSMNKMILKIFTHYPIVYLADF